MANQEFFEKIRSQTILRGAKGGTGLEKLGSFAIQIPRAPAFRELGEAQDQIPEPAFY